MCLPTIILIILCYCRGVDYEILYDHIAALTIGGYKENFKVLVPVLSRCGEEISQKAADYSKTVVFENIASIMSILGVADDTERDPSLIDCPTIELTSNNKLVDSRKLMTSDSSNDSSSGSSTDDNHPPQRSTVSNNENAGLAIKQESMPSESLSISESVSIKCEPTGKCCVVESSRCLGAARC